MPCLVLREHSTRLQLRTERSCVAVRGCFIMKNGATQSAANAAIQCGDYA